MKISVVIPTLNEAKYIGRTITYLKQYGGEHIAEIIIVDGGSSDDTAQNAGDAGALVIRTMLKCRGAQMNEGARHCKGDILYFVHADTQPPTTYANDIIAAFAEGWLMGNFQYRFDSSSLLLHFNAIFTRFSWLFCQGGDKTFFIQRNLFFSLGAYDPEHIVMEEYDFLRRAKKAGYRWVVLPAKCVVSARKYNNNSWIRVQIANIVVYKLWQWGWAKPKRLKEIYWKILYPYSLLFFVVSALLSLSACGISHTSNRLGRCQDPGFDKEVSSWLRFKVPAIDVDSLRNMSTSVLLLDAREPGEYKVSHLPGAIHCGYRHFDKALLRNTPKSRPIVVYCSIGYRSEKIVRKISKMGFTNVTNLYGSIFEWANRGYPIVDDDNQPTNRLHTYNKSWGKWVKEDKCEKVH